VPFGFVLVRVRVIGSDNTPSETRINQHEELFIKKISPKPSMTLASSQTYQKLSSNGLDLAELEQKPVDHRQIPIGPVGNVCDFQEAAVLAVDNTFQWPAAVTSLNPSPSSPKSLRSWRGSRGATMVIVIV
jgi:hypothetical protein